MKINTPKPLTSLSTALLVAAVASLTPLAWAGNGTARGGASDLIAVNPQSTVKADAPSRAGKACPSCRTVPVTLKLDQSKAYAPVTIAAQKHECAKCDTKTQTVGHGKMRQTVVSHVCQEKAAMTCCSETHK